MDRPVDEGLLRESATARVDPDGEDEAGLPAGGTLVWIPPEGEPREIDPGRLRRTPETTTPAEIDPEPNGALLADGDGARGCVGCGHGASVATIVREHEACGRVGVDGFRDRDGRIVCPKCDLRPDGPFPVVATVESCLRCGRVLDRPLGR